jgi:alkanesulfonate monooxygenase SsuD/methylene tetrahydromethanopterin reductase-like flavin-dependent oxidoreductase (luciferase family)
VTLHPDDFRYPANVADTAPSRHDTEPIDRPHSGFAEWLEIVARLIRGETVTYDGTYYSVRDATLDPAPPHRIPILVAGHRPRMLSLIAQWADAWNTAWYGVPSDKLDERLETLREALQTANRPADTITRTAGLIVRDPNQHVADPSPHAIEVQNLPEALNAYHQRGINHAIISPEPMTPTTTTQIAKAATTYKNQQQ